MLISISTPTISVADKQFLMAALEQLSVDVCVVCIGDGVYAPTIESLFFEEFTNHLKEESPLNLAFVDSDASARGAKLPEQAMSITSREFAALSAKNTHWVTL